MKISILTSTYQRGELLKQLYQSLVENEEENIQLEWLIMDDGSTDNTKAIVQEFTQGAGLKIQYDYQENQGKMRALNNLLDKVTGEVMIECDSDDYFIKGAMKKIEEAYEKVAKETSLYAMCFLKENTKGKRMGEELKEEKTTLFDLRFQQGIDGERALVFFSKVRKQYPYPIEREEKFVTEARLYYQMEENYQIQPVNEVIEICEYQEEGYSNNMKSIFCNNPHGYYLYFQEILNRNKGRILWKQWLYAMKHYILFSYLTKEEHPIQKLNKMSDKIGCLLLWIPGRIKSLQYAK